MINCLLKLIVASHGFACSDFLFINKPEGQGGDTYPSGIVPHIYYVHRLEHKAKDSDLTSLTKVNLESGC